MKVIKDFSCKCGNKFEKMVDNEDKHAECPGCQSEANVVYSLNFVLNGTDGSFPTASDKWAKCHEKGGIKH